MMRLALLLLTLAAFSSQQAASFWFTDTSLFQAPLQQAAQQLFGQQQATEGKQQLQATDQQQQQTVTAEAGSSQVELLAKSSEPWLRVEPAVVPAAKQIEPILPQEPVAQGAFAALQFRQQQQQCQCNSDWLRNQTGVYLNKWLSSPNVASQMRLLLFASNSTGAQLGANANSSSSSSQEQQQSQRRRDAHHSGNGANNHWAAWIRSKGNNANGSQARTARNKPANSQQEQQQPERGPQGPKGEQGARGPSGLISVKDRNGLFDLPAPMAIGSPDTTTTATTTTSSNSPGEKQGAEAATANPNERLAANTAARLVFVEAEQMLVVGTEAGWRPVQLLAPLRDFRKAIAKFSLSSPEDRRRLLSSSGGRRVAAMDNSIKPLRRHEEANNNVARGADRSGQNGQLAWQGYAAQLGYEDADGDDDAIGDDEDDEDDEEEDDDEEDDEEDAEDDMEDSEVGGNDLDQQRQPRRRLTMAPATSGTNQTPTAAAPSGSSSSTQVVSGRSATAAALVSASMLSGDNSVGKLQQRQQQPPASAESPSRRGNSNAATDARIMKLRMAALNEPFSGNVHGIRGADFECKRNAAKANVKGSFRAFLAAGFQSLNEVVRYNVHKYPIVNLRGESLANSWHDLFKQPARIANPLSRIYSFDGRHVATDSKWPNKLVWHGAANKAGYRDLQQNCDGWHSDSLNKFGLATPVHLPRVSGGLKTRRQRKRYLAELGATSTITSMSNSNQAAAPTSNNNNSNQTLSSPAQLGGEHGGLAFLEGIEKYPCRMPLILLCIETIGQQFSEQQWNNNRRFSSVGGNLVIDGGDESPESNNTL